MSEVDRGSVVAAGAAESRGGRAMRLPAAAAAPAGGSVAACTCASEVMSRKRSSRPSASKRGSSASAQYTSTRASSGAPMSLASRSFSSSRVTSPRSAMSVSQSMASLDTGGSACQISWKTDSRRSPGRYPHTSSAVNDRIGASQRTMPSAMCHMAVCAERRAVPAAGVVYMRSLITSR